MKGSRIAVSLLAAFICTLLLAPAGEKLAEPRELLETPNYFTLPDREGVPVPSIAGMGPGSPSSLCTLDSWITSDLMANDMTTDFLWLDSEQLRIVISFFTTKQKIVRSTVKILNANKVQVFWDEFTGFPITGDVSAKAFDVGALRRGPHQVQVKIKQGKKTAGMKFWIIVQ